MMARLAAGELPALCHTISYQDGVSAMFSVTVRDHLMIAHSFRGEVFGPAQRLHGATYVVDATLPPAEPGPGQPGGRHRPGRRPSCAPCWPSWNYRNLDDDAAFAGQNTTTELLAQVIADRLAMRIRAGALGESARQLTGLTVTLHESHVAWASYERPL